MSNFDFLDGCSEVELYEHSRELEKCYVLGMYSLMPNISRQYIESFYEELKSNERIFLPSYLNNKSGFDLNKKTEYFEKEVKDFCSISEYCATLISIGHVGSHNNKKNVDERKALEILKFTHRLSEWFFKKYYDVNDETFNFVVPSHVNIEEVINENKDLKNRVNSQQEKIQSIIKERDNLVLNNETLAKQNDFLSKSEQKIDKKKIDSLIVELAQSYKVEINRLQEKLEKEQKENINYHSQCDILKREIEEKTVSLKNKENILKHNQKLENINDSLKKHIQILYNKLAVYEKQTKVEDIQDENIDIKEEQDFSFKKLNSFQLYICEVISFMQTSGTYITENTIYKLLMGHPAPFISYFNFSKTKYYGSCKNNSDFNLGILTQIISLLVEEKLISKDGAFITPLFEECSSKDELQKRESITKSGRKMQDISLNEVSYDDIGKME